MKKSRRGNIDFSSMLSPEARAVRELVAKMPPLPVPPTVRECAALGLSPYGFPPRRTSMRPAHTRELLERYPALYRHANDKPILSPCEPFARGGFECGDGWFALIDRLSSKLVVDPNLVVGQLKEKMGLLTIYFNITELASPDIEAATDDAYDEAREESKRTCEICGVPGVYKKARGTRVSVLCAPRANGSTRSKRLVAASWIAPRVWIYPRSLPTRIARTRPGDTFSTSARPRATSRLSAGRACPKSTGGASTAFGPWRR
jgi:hypothetical protein